MRWRAWSSSGRRAAGVLSVVAALHVCLGAVARHAEWEGGPPGDRGVLRDDALAGRWEGVIGEVPPPLGVKLDLTRDGGAWAGSLTLADSGEALTLRDVRFDASAGRLTFSVSD